MLVNPWGRHRPLRESKQIWELHYLLDWQTESSKYLSSSTNEQTVDGISEYRRLEPQSSVCIENDAREYTVS